MPECAPIQSRTEHSVMKQTCHKPPFRMFHGSYSTKKPSQQVTVVP